MKTIDPEHHNKEFRIDLLEYWRIVWRKKLLIFIPIVISAIIAGVGVRFLKPVYQSSATIKVEDTQFSSAQLRQFVATDNRQQRRDQDRVMLKRIEAAIAGKDFQDQLIRRLDLDEIPSLIEQAEYLRQTKYPHTTTEELVYRRLRELLSRKSGVKLAGPGLFQIYFYDQNPDDSFLVVDAMAGLYVEIQARGELEGLRDSGEFTDEQIAIYKQRLERSERELENYQRSTAERDLEANPIGETNIRIAETHLNQIEVEIQDKISLVEKIGSRVDQHVGTRPSESKLSADRQAKDLRENLIARHASAMMLEISGVGAASPETMENQKEAAEAEREIQRYISEFARRQHPDAHTDHLPLLVEYYYQLSTLMIFREEKVRLNDYINSYKKRLARAPQVERELKRLREEVETNRELYNSFLKAKAETQISEAVEHTSFGAGITIVEKPERPLVPVRPNKLKILALAIIFGGIIGLSSLILTEYSDSSFKKIEDIEEKLGFRVLGTIPPMEGAREWKDRSKGKRATMWVVTWVLASALSISGFYFLGKKSDKEALEISTTSAVQSSTGESK